jgi:hypothetical protein
VPPADLVPAVEHPRATRPRRLGQDLEDERHERARVVRRRERIADERDRLAGITRGRVSLPALAARLHLWRGGFVRNERSNQRDENDDRQQRSGDRSGDQQQRRCGIERP